MSIRNIFKCCKKNRIIGVVAGVTLGFSSSAGFMDQFLNKAIPIAPIENPDLNPDPGNISTMQPVEPVKLGPSKTYLNLFLGSTVVIIGGLTILSYGGGIMAISLTAYNMLNYLAGRMHRRGLQINRNRANILRDNNPGFKPVRIKDIKKIVISTDEDFKRIIDKNVNETKEQYEERIKKITENNRDNIIKLNEEFNKAQRENNERIKKMFEETSKTIFFNIDEKVMPKILDLENKFSNLSKSKTVFFEKSEEEEEEEETSLSLENITDQDRIQVIDSLLIKNQEQDQVLFNNIVNNTLVNVQNKFYDEYMENIEKMITERTFENNGPEVRADSLALRDLYNRFEISVDATIGQLLPENLQLNPSQNNLSERFYTTAYKDYKNFLNYGRIMVMGDNEIRDNNGTIEEIIKMREFINPERLKITYDTIPETVYTLTFVHGNFAHRLKQQFENYILKIFNRLRYIGIARFDPVLSKLLKIVAQNKFPSHIKIITVPILENITKQTLNTNIDFNITHGENYFSFQFKNNQYFILGSESIEQMAEFSEKYDNMNISVNHQGANLLKFERYKIMAKETLKILIDMMNRRDSYVDLIMIIEKIYEKYFPSEHAKTIL